MAKFHANSAFESPNFFTRVCLIFKTFLINKTTKKDLKKQQQQQKTIMLHLVNNTQEDRP